jgi:hypothetical protein
MIVPTPTLLSRLRLQADQAKRQLDEWYEYAQSDIEVAAFLTELCDTIDESVTIMAMERQPLTDAINRKIK